MAAGKSRVGRRLAAELALPFVDTDAAIVARHGSIADIFAREGEPAFREYEFDAVQSALDGPTAVVALGGGAVTHAPTRALLAERALRVFLDVPIGVVMARLRRSRTVRPLVGTLPDENRVRALLSARLPFYREAEIVVDCGHRSSALVAHDLVARLRE